MKVHLYDPLTKREYVGDLSEDELPIIPQLIGQWSGNVMITVATGGHGAIKHATTNIKPHADVADVLLAPFQVVPKIAGYYAVHHQRREYIYSANIGGYEVKLYINDTLCSGTDATKINDVSIAQQYSDADRVKLNLTATVYCNGTTDTIELDLSHTYSGSRDFGSISGADSVTHTSIWYLGPKIPVELSGEAIGLAVTDALLAGSGPIELTGEAIGVGSSTASLM